jgi:hypothetical protein
MPVLELKTIGFHSLQAQNVKMLLFLAAAAPFLRKHR